MPIRLAALLLMLLAGPAMAQERVMLERALDAAIATFETALPRLAGSELGVDVSAYRDALTLQRFQSERWGGEVAVELIIREGAEGSCSRFAAFVRIPREWSGQAGALPAVLLGWRHALRELTLLHEMVHAVAGPDECQAMAFAARVQEAAQGRFTPVEAYWQNSGCTQSGYRLPD